jgi:sugar phosphate isomerase/epimerase
MRGFLSATITPGARRVAGLENDAIIRAGKPFTEDLSMYSRRDFGKIALAGVPLSVAVAKINSEFGGVRVGAQSYSFRDRSLDEAIAAMVEIGIGHCEMYSGHVEPNMRAPGGRRGGAEAEALRQKLREWRLSTPLSEFEAVRKKFDDAGIVLAAYNLSFRDDFTDEEIDRGFEMAKALGVDLITASSTLTAAKRVAPFADRHRISVAMHGHSDLEDPNQFAKPESFEKAMAMSKYFKINLDIGHFVAANYDPLDYIEKHHAHIPLIHVKDRKKDQGPNTVWGEGDTPIKAALGLLKRNKYPILANIEYEYRGEDTVAEVRKCFEYCKAGLA